MSSFKNCSPRGSCSTQWSHNRHCFRTEATVWLTGKCIWGSTSEGKHITACALNHHWIRADLVLLHQICGDGNLCSRLIPKMCPSNTATQRSSIASPGAQPEQRRPSRNILKYQGPVGCTGGVRGLQKSHGMSKDKNNQTPTSLLTVMETIVMEKIIYV